MYKIFKYNINTNTILYYIYFKTLTLKNIDNSFGHIQISIDNNTMTVTSLYSRKKGCGTKLMMYSCKEQYDNGIKYIELDDCSERYREDHNIYVKFGMKYVDEYGPEMSGSIKNIINYIK